MLFLAFSHLNVVTTEQVLDHSNSVVIQGVEHQVMYKDLVTISAVATIQWLSRLWIISRLSFTNLLWCFFLWYCVKWNPFTFVNCCFSNLQAQLMKQSVSLSPHDILSNSSFLFSSFDFLVHKNVKDLDLGLLT